MKQTLTGLLAAAVVVLGLHLAVAIWWPSLIATYYPASVARLYAGKSGTGKREEIARLEPVAGRPGVSSVTLTPLAVEKLGIATVPLETAVVERVRAVSSVVLAGAGLPSSAPPEARAAALVVAVPLSGKVDQPAPAVAAQVVPLAGGSQVVPARASDARLEARPVGIVDQGPIHARERTAYFVLGPGADGLEPGDAVTVRLPLVGNRSSAGVLPSSAVLYEPNGTTWVYTNPAPQVFVREQLQIDFMGGGRAVLKSGPPPGTRIVTVGAFELYGAESAIGVEKVGR